MKSTNLSLAVACLALLGLLPGCEMLQNMQRPGVALDGVTLQGLDLQGLTLEFDLRVSNPYGVPLPVAGLDYALASRGAAFLDGRSDGATTIPARGSEVVPVSARITFVQALQTLTGIKPGAVVPYEAKLGISVEPPGMAPLRLPIETEGTFPIPTVPSVSLAAIRWTELSLSRARAEMQIDVGNLNQFPVDLAGLAASVALGGTDIVTSRTERPLNLGAGEQGRLTIPIEFAPSRLGLAAFRMLSGSGAGYALKGSLDGSTPFGPLQFPFESTGQTTFSR